MDSYECLEHALVHSLISTTETTREQDGEAKALNIQAIAPASMTLYGKINMISLLLQPPCNKTPLTKQHWINELSVLWRAMAPSNRSL